MFDTSRITDCFVAHPRHSHGYDCGSLSALGARIRVSACTQTCGLRYQHVAQVRPALYSFGGPVLLPAVAQSVMTGPEMNP
jgi:hypothetical protein